MPSDSPPNFTGKNLRGRSFRNLDLSGTNFSYADLRGADFSHATLRDSCFTAAQTGLQARWRLLGCIALILLFFLFALLAALAGLYLGWLFLPEMIADNTIVPGIAISFLIIINALIILQRGLQAGVRSVVNTTILTIAISVGSLILIGIPKLIRVTDLLGGGMINALGITLSFGLIYPVGFAAFISITNSPFLTLVVTTIAATIGTWIAGKSYPHWQAYVTSGLGSFSILLLSAYLGWQAWKGNGKYHLIQQLAISLVSKFGTNFSYSDLTQANFTQANLKHANFKQANLHQTNFYRAQNLAQARSHHTILSDPKVGRLLITHQGRNHGYQGCNLKGADLAGADLRGADLTEADLSGASLAGANLQQSNWTKAQAIGSNFRQAQLTGACLEAWNIDDTTQLEAVICDYIYLRNYQQERRPSSGNFAPGDFTELFQEIIHTIDLIFRNGIDQTAFNYSIQQIQLENDGIPLTIRSLERKGNGVVVVRVDVPSEADKTILHRQFSQHYEQAIVALTAQYETQLQAKNEQIALYQQQQADWQTVLQLLKANPTIGQSAHAPQRVTLQIGEGNPEQGFAVTLQINHASQTLQFTQGRLAPVQALIELYEQWQISYRQSLSASQNPLRLDIIEDQVTHVGRSQAIQDCQKIAQQLTIAVNNWLDAEVFRPIKERMLEQLQPAETIEILLQTDDRNLRQFPWQLWQFFDRYPKAELALGTPNYESIQPTNLSTTPTPKIKILAILGDSTGINLQHDRQQLAEIPDASVTFLVEPTRQVLNDHLWQQSWDILFFAGHSFSKQDQPSNLQSECETGYFQINTHDRLQISDLKNALRHAIAQGLRLGIFNSCDGLGLARQLADLQLPYFVVMREPIPDRVAQEFLRNFLTHFSQGNSLYQTLRSAREQLQGLEPQFPCAPWLPILFQNPAAPSLFWQDLQQP